MASCLCNQEVVFYTFPLAQHLYAFSDVVINVSTVIHELISCKIALYLAFDFLYRRSIRCTTLPLVGWRHLSSHANKQTSHWGRSRYSVVVWFLNATRWHRESAFHCWQDAEPTEQCECSTIMQNIKYYDCFTYYSRACEVISIIIISVMIVCCYFESVDRTISRCYVAAYPSN